MSVDTMINRTSFPLFSRNLTLTAKYYTNNYAQGYLIKMNISAKEENTIALNGIKPILSERKSIIILKEEKNNFSFYLYIVWYLSEVCSH